MSLYLALETCCSRRCPPHDTYF